MSNRNRADRPAAPPLVLASGSPRRREYLALLGARFRVRAPAVPEAPRPGERPADLALRLSLAKAEEVAARHGRVHEAAGDEAPERTEPTEATGPPPVAVPRPR